MTTLCVSIAARPGTLGTTLHTAGYRALGLDFAYVACRVVDIAAAIAGVRALGIRGCSVSMPFKEQVVPLLDAVEEEAARIGAVNAIVNEDGRLRGHNTDVDGAAAALRAVDVRPGDVVMVLGAGGMARAAAEAVRRIDAGLVVTSRSIARAEVLAAMAGGRAAAWADRDSVEAAVVFNATALGMKPEDPAPIDGLAGTVRAGIDAVVSTHETAFARLLRGLGRTVVPGAMLGLHQAAAQFSLYTGHDAPLDVMRAALEESGLAA